MNAENIWQIGTLIALCTIATAVYANPAENFLNSVISQLKRSQIPASSSHRSLYDELFRPISRSSEEFQIPEAPEPSENSFYEQNFQFDQSQNQIFKQFDAFQNQANFAAGNSLNVDDSDGLLQQQQQQPSIIGLQQFNVNGYLNLPPPEAPAQVTEPPQDIDPQNTGPNLFNAHNIGNPASIAVATFDPQFLIQNLPSLPNVGQPNDVLQNHEPQQVPTYYFYHPDPAANENLVDDTFDAALRPLEESEQLLGVPPGKKVVVEPLFVAMAGFVGIAMIFMSAVLFLPKILSPPPDVSSLKGPQELAALTKLAVETIEGKDCTERIACEVGRAMRSMQVSSKPIKVLEVVLPANLAKQLAQIRRAVANKKTCRLIQCKRVKPIDQKAKIAESKIVAETEPPEPPSTKAGEKRQKEKTQTHSTTASAAKQLKTTTKAPTTKLADKKASKEQDKKGVAPPKSAEKKIASKKGDEKKSKETTQEANTTEWEFSIFT